MTKTRFIGDVHGHDFELELVLSNCPVDVSRVIQVGDMGVGFGQGNYWHDKLDILMQKHNAKFIRGNHDSPGICKTMKSWVRDGIIENDMMFIGGAWSIDYQWRTPGISWWEDEELSHVQLNTLIDVYDMVRPNVMITHDCPLSISKHLFIDTCKSIGSVQHKTRTGIALERMFEIHKPKLWVFGHWHNDADEIIDGTRFICLNELSYVDIDTETMEVMWPEFQKRRGKP